MTELEAPRREAEEPRARRAGFAFFIGLVVLSTLLLALASWLEGSGAWRHPLRWLATLDDAGALSLLAGSAQIVAGVLAILITVVAFIVEMAANRYTHRITSIFFSDRVNLAVMTFFVLTTALCVWGGVVLAGETTAPPLLPRGGFLLAMSMMTASLLMLLPYFVYVFNFVSPMNVIRKIRAAALASVEGAHGGDARAAKREVIDAVEELEDVARSAMRNSDRSIAMAAVEALADLLRDVTQRRAQLAPAWFLLDEAVVRDADFVSMARPTLDEIAQHGSWFESKILRQFLALYRDAVGEAREVASMIAIHTRQLAELDDSGESHLLELCQRAFHSYLRAAIVAKDQRTAYNVQHQYRLLAQMLLERGREPAALEVARRIRYYGRLASTSELPFLLEVAAYDLTRLIEAAAEKHTLRDALLEIVLTVDHEGAENLQNVRRAQIQLATFFLARGEEGPARRIAEDLRGERRGLLTAAREEIERELSPNYYEINERGVNFPYLPPERRAMLGEFFAMLGKGA